MINLSEINSADSSDFGLLPEGEYSLKLLELSLKETRSGTGKYLDFCFVIDEGQYANRRLWVKFNVVNDSPKAVNFTLKNLKSLFEAAKIEITQFDLDDGGVAFIRQIMSQDRRVKANIVTQEATNGYSAKNEVEPYSWSPSSMSAPATPPWERVGLQKVPF